ncbi:MAG TPA: YvrJ family protein [Pseudogracilibacillus sp.]|nr:YvrJ family protein [Pseudogracilibacillus sp.]
METWLAFVTELGFPVVITFYLLHRIENKLDVLNESIRVLPHEIREKEA